MRKEVEAYQVYIALKAHFTTNYDYHRYNGKIKNVEQQFYSRNDCYYFTKLSRKKDIFGYLVSNNIPSLFNTDYKWIGDMIDDPDSDKIYSRWIGRKAGFSYLFKTELNKIGDLENSINKKIGNMPELIWLMLNNKISPETFCVLTKVTNPYTMWNVDLGNDIFYKKIVHIAKKYASLLEFDTDKIKKIIIDHINS